MLAALPVFSSAVYSRASNRTIGSRYRTSVRVFRRSGSTPGVEHRIFYVAKFREGIYVLHAFEKRTRKTAKRDVTLGRDRLRALLMRRQTVDATRE